MILVAKVISRLRRAWYGAGYTREHWSRAERIAYLESVVEYLTWQTRNQAALLRHLAAPMVDDLPAVRRTKESFDFQWAEIPTGRHMLDHPAFRAEATDYVSQFTGLPPEWFRGKRVVDVGCGMGRYSWALCALGADVLSMDQSDHGLRHTADACREFPSHQTLEIDLLKPLPVFEQADLVWSFGVLHHTNTYKAFRNVAPLVKPGGYLYLMIYGSRGSASAATLRRSPNGGVASPHREPGSARQAESHSHNMAAGGFQVTGDEYVHGYFDAIAPPINDLHTFQEIEGWLIEAGFVDIKRTVPSRNIHVIGRKGGTP